jgi:O-antigen/teichoic acid export membrane protein
MLPDGNTEAGIYAQAFRLLDAASMVPFLFAGLLLPMFSRMIKNKEAVQPLLAFAYSLLIIPAMAFTCSCIFYRVDLMSMFYHHHSQESSVILGFLMVSFSFISINYIFGTLLTANGNINLLNKISLLGVILSISINLLIIPEFKSPGAAFTNMIVQFTVMVIQIFAAWKIINFNLRREGVRNFILFFIGSIGLTYGTKFFIGNWIIGFLVSGIGIGLLGLLFKLLKIKEIIQLFFEDKDELRVKN